MAFSESQGGITGCHIWSEEAVKRWYYCISSFLKFFEITGYDMQFPMAFSMNWMQVLNAFKEMLL